MIHDKTIGYLKRKLLDPHFIAVAKNEIPIIKKHGIDGDHTGMLQGRCDFRLLLERIDLLSAQMPRQRTLHHTEAIL